MPLTPVNYEDIVPVFEEALECVVTIMEIEGVSKAKKKCGGFIVHCSDNLTVIAVHSFFEFGSQKIVVKFSNGTESADTHLIKLRGPINLVAVEIPLGDWKEVKYSEIIDSSEVVFSIAFVFGKMLPFISRIISPNCTSVDANGAVIAWTEETFSFNLTLGGEIRTKLDPSYYETSMMLTSRILGGPVFNTDGHLVGFHSGRGQSYDLKFGLRSEVVHTVLDNWLAKREWKVAIQSEINKVQKSRRGPKQPKLN